MISYKNKIYQLYFQAIQKISLQTAAAMPLLFNVCKLLLSMMKDLDYHSIVWDELFCKIDSKLHVRGLHAF